MFVLLRKQEPRAAFDVPCHFGLLLRQEHFALLV